MNMRDVAGVLVDKGIPFSFDGEEIRFPVPRIVSVRDSEETGACRFRVLRTRTVGMSPLDEGEIAIRKDLVDLLDLWYDRAP